MCINKKSKRNIEKVILKSVNDYICASKPFFKIKNFTEIKNGKNYAYKDSGVYVVNLKNKKDQNKNLSLLVKKHTKLKRRYLLPYHPIKKRFGIPLIKKRSFAINIETISKNREKANIHNISILPCLYFDIKNCISIRKMAPGIVGLKKAFEKNPQKCLSLIYQAGLNLGKLHSIGLISGDWKPEHIVFDFKKNKIYLIDYEQMREVFDIKNYINELNGKFKFYFTIAVPNKHLKPLWQSFINGYADSDWPKAKYILSKVSTPKPYFLAYKYFLIFLRKIDLSVGKISRGYLKL